MTADHKAIQAKVITAVTDYLKAKLHTEDTANLKPFIKVIEYAVLGSGKMLRPFFVCTIGEILNVAKADLIRLAAAIELIHCYSLIHDDLPAMDNDDYRRGMLSTHKRFGEANAILAGDAIQALAFEVLAEINHPNLGKVVKEFARAIGINGLVGGQYLDLNFTAKDTPSLEFINQIILNKTACLFRLSAMLPAYLMPYPKQDLAQSLDEFGTSLGMAYQIIDDLVDAKSCTSDVALTQAAGVKLAPTILSVIASDKARQLAQQLLDNAKDSISVFDDKAEPIIAMLDDMRASI